MINMERPKDNQHISFKDKKGNEHEGIFIEDENMFFIGFEETGDFLYFAEVVSWKPLED